MVYHNFVLAAIRVVQYHGQRFAGSEVSQSYDIDRVVFLHLSVSSVAEGSREIAVDEVAADGDLGGFTRRLVERGRT